MTLQNRVDPFGQIHADPSRGTMFGNRGGCMHKKKELVGRPWSNERWICCLLEFKDRKRCLMTEGLYTELFFLDEATAFAAGHRPCMECRRQDANRFIAAWSKAHLPPGQKLRTISHIDQIAHRERIDPKTHVQKTSRVQLSTLPDGVFITLGRDVRAALACEVDHALIARKNFGLEPSYAGSLGMLDQTLLHRAAQSGSLPGRSYHEGRLGKLGRRIYKIGSMTDDLAAVP